MHDLVQEMGHYIVRGEHPNNPEKHSRVWKREDVLKICAVDATTELDKIEAITANYDSFEEEEDLPPVVANMKNLRYIHWKGVPANPLLNNFPPRELRCLILHKGLQKQLWEGYKHLPNFKVLELQNLHNLIMTPDFDGLPNLERFRLKGCKCLEEIHPSIGRLKRLVFLSIKNCPSLKMFLPITQLKKLETLTLSECPALFKLSKIQQQNMDNLPHFHLDTSEKQFCLEEHCFPQNNMNHHTVLRFFPGGLRKLDLRCCSLGDKDIGSAVWELPNLEELSLGGNEFSRLNFSLLQLPRLKLLNVSGCEKLVELSELPLSIAVLKADWCTSLETFGDTSKYKWLWKVSLQGTNKLGSLVGDILLDSMLQGNAIEHHFISVALERQTPPERFLGRLIRGKTFRLHLPDNWYNDFCGFIICIVSEKMHPPINIIIRQEVDEDSRSELRHESNEALDPEYDKTAIFLGYVSFSSMRHTKLWNSSYNIISVSLDSMYWSSLKVESYVGAELIPRKFIGDQVQRKKVTADCSEFWDKKYKYGTTFTIQDDSIQILWKHGCYLQKKLIFKVDVHNDKEKEDILKIVSSLSGVQSSTIDMKDKKLTVIGDFDAVTLLVKLEKFSHTKILSIVPAKGVYKLIRA